jgi:hypothetical protein
MDVPINGVVYTVSPIVVALVIRAIYIAVNRNR